MPGGGLLGGPPRGPPGGGGGSSSSVVAFAGTEVLDEGGAPAGGPRPDGDVAGADLGFVSDSESDDEEEELPANGFAWLTHKCLGKGNSKQSYRW